MSDVSFLNMKADMGAAIYVNAIGNIQIWNASFINDQYFSSVDQFQR